MLINNMFIEQLPHRDWETPKTLAADRVRAGAPGMTQTLQIYILGFFINLYGLGLCMVPSLRDLGLSKPYKSTFVW
jgi:hypothetical protein